MIEYNKNKIYLFIFLVHAVHLQCATVNGLKIIAVDTTTTNIYIIDNIRLYILDNKE